MNRKPLPVGIEFFKEIIEKEYYYVDKTLLIKDLVDKGGKVSLFTRPRRFGKTLSLTMLQAFFEDERTSDGQKMDNAYYFEGLSILSAGEKYCRHMGQYPVIFLSLKSAKQPSYEMAYESLKDDIQREFDRHSYVLGSAALSEAQKRKYCELMCGSAQEVDYAKSLKFLSECLYKYCGKKAILLLDEYDVPLENAYFRGFYDCMTDFIRSLFESALKTNESLEFSVITGCLRISRESIFTGLNHLEIISILNPAYGEYFGFLPEEVQTMLRYYGLSSKEEEVKEWYDGYLFGNSEVYNPWSIVNYVNNATADYYYFPRPYWSNTSSNSIVKELVERADLTMKQEMESLIEGGIIEKPVYEDVTYGDIYKTQDNLWNFLFFTGYLKKVSEQRTEENVFLKMAIPNAEIRYVYRNTIMEWFDRKVKTMDRSELYAAVMSGDTKTIEKELSACLRETISFYDYAESYYHGFLAGMLSGMEGCVVVSNRESGEGRPDIMVKPADIFYGTAVVFEVKYARNFDEIDGKRKEAVTQIREKEYTAELWNEGYRKILKYAVCFYRKNCVVELV